MASSSSHIKIKAPAKINLTLNVTGKREDGYHLLHSLTYFSDFGDEITLTPHPKFKFTLESEFKNIPTDNQNLVVQMAQKLASHYNQSLNCHIHLNKRIPSGAGLGGGSSDAAATAKALLKFWNIQPNQNELNALLLELGADIPVCYHAQPCLFSGIGEIIEPLENAPNLYLVLVHPNISTSTIEVFKNLKISQFHTPIIEENFDILKYILEGRNDLTDAAIEKTPTIKDVLDALTNTKNSMVTRMTGSGSCCFGLYPSKHDADEAAHHIQNVNPSCWVKSVIAMGNKR